MGGILMTETSPCESEKGLHRHGPQFTAGGIR